MRPMIKRISDCILQGVGKFFKFFPAAFIARAIGLIHPAGAHCAPFIVIAGKPKLRNILGLLIFINFLWA